MDNKLLPSDQEQQNPVVISGEGAVKKPNSLLVMLPFTKLNPLTRKIFNVLVQKTQQQAPALYERHGVIPNGYPFRIRIDQLVKPLEAGKANLRTSVRERVDEMMDIKLKWDTPDLKGRKDPTEHELEMRQILGDEAGRIKWFRENWLTGIREVEDEFGITWIEWGFGETMTKIITRPGIYTPVSFDQLAKLRRYASISLYEICYRYRNNARSVTSSAPTQWWINALSEIPPALDENGKEKPRSWPNYKDKAVNDAIAEVNEKTDINVELIEIKSGKRIAEVQFKVTMKDPQVLKQTESDMPLVQVSQALSAKGLAAGIEPAQLAMIKQSGLSEELIEHGLNKLQRQNERQQIDKPFKYLKKIVEFDGAVAPAKLATQEILPAVAAPSEPFIHLVKTEEEHQAEETIQTIRLLPPEQQKALAAEALRGIGIPPTPGIRRKIEAGEWYTMERLANKMIELYQNRRAA